MRGAVERVLAKAHTTRERRFYIHRKHILKIHKNYKEITKIKV